MKRDIRVLFATRAYESPHVEGGFNLLRDLANTFAKLPGIAPTFFSLNNATENNINKLRVFKDVGWGGYRRIEYFIGLLRYQKQFDVIHTAHVPTLLNSSLLRIIKVLGKKSGVTYVQTITALPEGNINKIRKVLWGDHIVCLSKSTHDIINACGISASLLTPWPCPNRVKFDNRRRFETRATYFDDFDYVITYPGEFKKLGVSKEIFTKVKALLDANEKACFVFACRFDVDGFAYHLKNMNSGKYADRILITEEIDWILKLLEASDLIVYFANKVCGKFMPPLVLLEAYCLNTPIISSDLIEIPADIEPDNPSWSCESNTIYSEHCLTENKLNLDPILNQNFFNDMATKYLSLYKTNIH